MKIRNQYLSLSTRQLTTKRVSKSAENLGQ
jgi:hypothetical protein